MDDDILCISNPWTIEFLHEDTSNDLPAQVANLTLNRSEQAAQPERSVSWPDHEKLTGELLQQAAHRTSTETFKNICVYHPTQSHKPSENISGTGIRPDYVLAWSCNGVRRNTAVVDAKDYHGQVPTREYEKIRRDMAATKATRGILVLGPDADVSEKLRAQIQQDGKVNIVQIGKDQNSTVRALTQHIGKMIDKNFVPDDRRWETYKTFVSSSNSEQERRVNRYGDNATYTSNGTYYRFNHPKKRDGTIDERYKANQDRNKDGGPDRRMAVNKTQQAQEQHLNQDGSDDMRSKEHREELVDETGHHLNVDGTRDKRCKENQVGSSSDNDTNQRTEDSDMRLKENRENMVDNEGRHLNIDGTLDQRCKESQEGETDVPTKADGTADLRFNVSQEAVASGAIEPDQQLTGGNETISGGESTVADIPTKADGTADLRFNVSQEAVASGEITDSQVLDGSGEGSLGEMTELSGGLESGGGPLKADGTPDMRFSANQ